MSIQRIDKRLPVPIVIPLLIGVVAISFSSILIKWCNAPASVMGMYRLVLSACLLLPLAWRQRTALSRLSVRDTLLLGVSGVFLGLHFLFWIGSLKDTSVASSIIITALQPVMVMVGAFFTFRERVLAGAQLSMAIAVVGVAVIAWGDFDGAPLSLHGDMLSFIGTVCISVYMLAGQSVRSRLPATLYNTVVFSIAAVLLALENLVTGTALTGYTLPDWSLFVLLALVPTLFGHALFNWLLRYVSATSISVMVLGEPIGAIVLAFLLLAEPVRWFQAVGGLVTLFGVALFLRVSTSKQTPQHPPAPVPRAPN